MCNQRMLKLLESKRRLDVRKACSTEVGYTYPYMYIHACMGMLLILMHI